MYIGFVITGIEYGTGQHHEDLSEEQILMGVRVSSPLRFKVSSNTMLTLCFESTGIFANGHM